MLAFKDHHIDSIFLNFLHKVSLFQFSVFQFQGSEFRLEEFISVFYPSNHVLRGMWSHDGPATREEIFQHLFAGGVRPVWEIVATFIIFGRGFSLQHSVFLIFPIQDSIVSADLTAAPNVRTNKVRLLVDFFVIFARA